MAQTAEERKAAIEQEKAEKLELYKMYKLSDLEPILSVTHRTLMSYVYSGKLKAVKICGKWRVSEQALQEFMKGDK